LIEEDESKNILLDDLSMDENRLLSVITNQDIKYHDPVLHSKLSEDMDLRSTIRRLLEESQELFMKDVENEINQIRKIQKLHTKQMEQKLIKLIDTKI